MSHEFNPLDLPRSVPSEVAYITPPRLDPRDARIAALEAELSRAKPLIEAAREYAKAWNGEGDAGEIWIAEDKMFSAALAFTPDAKGGW